MNFKFNLVYFCIVIFFEFEPKLIIAQLSEISHGSCNDNNATACIANDLLPNSIHTSDTMIKVEGTADISHKENGILKIKSNFNVSKTTGTFCPGLEDASTLTQTQLIVKLTDPCRYDRLERPVSTTQCNDTGGCPEEVYMRVYVYVMQNLDSSDLQFNMHGLLQMRFVDSRLAFGAYAPNRTQAILGESQLRELIWVPHIFLANEHDSSVLGTDQKDILTSISPDGTVIISSRIKATLYCWMNLKKFPFDEQRCSTIMESWMYNSSQLLLHWEKKTPVAFDPKMRLTEYILESSWTNETIVNADLDDLRHGSLVGNYSSLSFTVHLTREAGYYMMDYFLPSMMIVAISWVSFWLQADQTPARTTLGTSTLLSFITLASSQDSNLPKVSYIKVSEVWFLGCTVFIFGSLIEFAFVNTIWRRNRSLELKKVNSKYIFKSTLTPNMHRRKMPGNQEDIRISTKSVNKFLTIETPVIITDFDDTSNSSNVDTSSTNTSANLEDKTTSKKKKDDDNSWFTMTPHEVSLWIDRKARFVFPLAFLIFNAIFWTIVYCL